MGVLRYQKPRGRAGSRRTRGRFLGYGMGFLGCLVLGAGVYEFYRYLRDSDLLSVRWVSVEGACVLEPEAIMAASQITRADNLLFFDRVGACARVEAMPYVKECCLDRVFFDQVVLTVEERTPVVTLLESNRLFELDAEGVVLRQLPADAVNPGPLVTNVPGLGYVEPGQRLSEAAVKAALGVWGAFMGTSMAGDVTVSELAAFGKNEVLMYCDELPFEIRWGRGDFAERARRLDILWREKGGELPCTQYLDLRFDRDLACE